MPRRSRKRQVRVRHPQVIFPTKAGRGSCDVAARIVIRSPKPVVTLRGRRQLSLLYLCRKPDHARTYPSRGSICMPDAAVGLPEPKEVSAPAKTVDCRFVKG
jgi:hypothetical protein